MRFFRRKPRSCFTCGATQDLRPSAIFAGLWICRDKRNCTP